MSKMYRSAQGKMVDVDRLRLMNEEVIAVGNMRVNARGDELGPGGEVVRNRNEVMDNYYSLNTPAVKPSYPDPLPTESSIHPPPPPPSTPVRGSLAQQLLRPNTTTTTTKSLNDPEGIE